VGFTCAVASALPVNASAAAIRRALRASVATMVRTESDEGKDASPPPEGSLFSRKLSLSSPT
jgi:hypothetical protein